VITEERESIMIKNNSTHKKAIEAHNGDNISFQPKARGSVRKGYSGAVATAPDGVLDNMRIRKLTPKECWRLQGFSDEQFDKAKAAGLSDAQLYKQAGNSVSIPVVKAIAERIK
jgi:DNA (cytosine-5)-methyltransferase 1